MTNRTSHILRFAFFGVIVIGCHPKAKSDEKDEAIYVKIATIQDGTINETTEVVASIKSRRSVLLQPHVEGFVTKIYVMPGDHVTRLTPLLQIDPAKQQATVQGVQAAQGLAQSEQARARAVLASTVASRASKLAQYKYSQQQVERTKRLFDNHLATAQEVDLQQRSLETSKADLEALDSDIAAQEANITASEQRVTQSEANAREQQEQLRFYTIVAPFDGIVGDIPVRVGERVTASSRLTTVDQNDTLEAYVYIPAERAADLRLGMTVRLLSSAGTPQVDSQITFLSPQVENSTQTVLFKSSFVNTNGLLRSGQIVRARIVWKQHTGLVLPRSAVMSMHGQDFVFVASGDVQSPTAAQRPVQLGPLDGDAYPVVGGLQLGDRVVVSGIQKLSDGASLAPL